MNPVEERDRLLAEVAELEEQFRGIGRLAETRAWAQERISESPRTKPGQEGTTGVASDQQAQNAAAEAKRLPLTRSRPASLDEMVGQEDLRRQLSIVIGGARLRGMPTPHVLLSGPPGFGKTSLAGIVAAEMGAPMVATSGLALGEPGDLVGVLTKIAPGSVVFVDEIHAAARTVLEMLYTALEDGTLPVVMGSGRDASAQTVRLPTFTLVGATTRPGLLTAPFRARFGFQAEVSRYTVDELSEIVARAWKRADVLFGESEPMEVARRCKGVPRLALHLADRTLDFAAVADMAGVPTGTAALALDAFGIDERGLTRQDWAVIRLLVGAAKPIGADAICSALDMDKPTLVDQIEPPLVQAGLIARIRTGRMATEAAFELLSNT